MRSRFPSPQINVGRWRFDVFRTLVTLFLLAALGVVVYLFFTTPPDPAGFFSPDPGAWMTDPGLAP